MPSLDTRSLLIVDDQEDMREALKILFSNRGLRVYLAGTPEEAMDCLSKTRIPMVLIDAHLDRASGASVVAFAKSLLHVPQILVMSGDIDDVRSRPEYASAAGFYEKPLDIDAIMKDLSLGDATEASVRRER